jgi:hypothetical protein
MNIGYSIVSKARVSHSNSEKEDTTTSVAPYAIKECRK